MPGLSFPRLVVGLLFGAIFLTACLMPAQPDTYWHLRAGQDFWATGNVPLVDHYSHTAAGRFWPNHEWLWQVVTFEIYRAGGFVLLTLAGASLVTAAYAMVYRLMVGPPMRRFVLMVMGVPLAASVWALRPQIASLAFLALLLTVIARERYNWLPALFALWANVHGAVALGGVVLGGVTVAALVRARRHRDDDPEARRRALSLLLVTPVCAAATAFTPLGSRLWTFIFESVARSREIQIDEWRPAYPTHPMEIAFWVLALSLVGVFVARRRTLKSWSDVALVAAAFAILPLAFRAGRNIAPFLLAAIPAASRLLGPGLAPQPRPESADRPRLNLAVAVAAALVGVATVGTAWASSLPSLGWRPVSAGALAAVQACPGRLYNRYNEGGYLIWLAPTKPVFIDSRQDPYPPAFVLEALRVEAAGDYQATFARHDVGCAFLPRESPTLPRLEAAGWTTRFSDEKWAVLVEPRR